MLGRFMNKVCHFKNAATTTDLPGVCDPWRKWLCALTKEALWCLDLIFKIIMDDFLALSENTSRENTHWIILGQS